MPRTPTHAYSTHTSYVPYLRYPCLHVCCLLSRRGARQTDTRPMLNEMCIAVCIRAARARGTFKPGGCENACAGHACMISVSSTAGCPHYRHHHLRHRAANLLCNRHFNYLLVLSSLLASLLIVSGWHADSTACVHQFASPSASDRMDLLGRRTGAIAKLWDNGIRRWVPWSIQFGVFPAYFLLQSINRAHRAYLA